MTMTSTDTLIGIHDDGWRGLNDSAKQRLVCAQLVIGAARTLALIEAHLPAHVECRSMDGQLGQLGQVAGWIKAARESGHNTVILATGDPMCHGIGNLLHRQLGNLEVMPAPSCLQLACARLGRAFQAYRVASCHNHDSGEWADDASNTPCHGLYPVLRALAHADHVAVFTSPENDPARLARALLHAGYASEEIRLSVVARLHLEDEIVIPDLSLDDAATRNFPSPNVVLIDRVQPAAYPLMGLADADYIQRQPEKGLITKQEVRAVSLARLQIRDSSVIWDIGAGSGSLGLEAARLARDGHVYAIEKNTQDADNARANAKRLQASNYTLQLGKAPEHLDAWPDPSGIFIGGSGGELAELIRLSLHRLLPQGRLVMNFVTLENLAVATQTLQQENAQWDVIQLQASRSQPILDMHRMAAQNPVWIITAHRP